jgi:thiol-disulfide isomerase/thioredoxin
MKQYILLAFVNLFFNPFANAQKIKISAKISDVDTMMVMVLGMNWCDTLYSTNGYVEYVKKMQHPELLRLIFVKNNQSIAAIKNGNERAIRSKEDGTYREIFSDSEDIIIEGRFSDIQKASLQVEKASNHRLYLEFRKRFDPLVKVARTIIDSSQGSEKTEGTRIYQMLYKKVERIEEDVAYQFAKENADNIVGAYILYRYCRIEDAGKLESLYRLFDDNLRATTYLENIKTKLSALKSLKPGKIVPDFTAIDSEGKQVKLDVLRGKYIVLDFWGSWCSPCIKGFPEMKTYQEKFKNQCMFIGIACNDEYVNWQKALKDHLPGWPQILNIPGERDIAKKYNVENYPTKVIIDPSGAFVTSFIGETTDFYQYLDKLFTNNTGK